MRHRIQLGLFSSSSVRMSSWARDSPIKVPVSMPLDPHGGWRKLTPAAQPSAPTVHHYNFPSYFSSWLHSCFFLSVPSVLRPCWLTVLDGQGGFLPSSLLINSSHKIDSFLYTMIEIFFLFSVVWYSLMHLLQYWLKIKDDLSLTCL